MTMPRYMNCNHSDDGWCLACVNELHERLEQLNDAKETLSQIHDVAFYPSHCAVDLIGKDGAAETLIERLGKMAFDALAKLDKSEATRQSQAVGVEWQPIDTAPKDRMVLLCLAGCEPCAGVWFDPKPYLESYVGWVPDGFAAGQWIGFDPEGMFETTDALIEYLIGTSYEPTHWMPMPPKVVANDSGKEGGGE